MVEHSPRQTGTPVYFRDTLTRKDQASNWIREYLRAILRRASAPAVGIYNIVTINGYRNDTKSLESDRNAKSSEYAEPRRKLS